MHRAQRFEELELGENALITPAGVMPLSEITRAEFVREVDRQGSGPSHQETSASAVAGGAVVGGALLGPAGVIGGAFLGSTVKESTPGAPVYQTTSVRIVFETGDLSYSIDIPRDREAKAAEFAKAVSKAARRHR